MPHPRSRGTAIQEMKKGSVEGLTQTSSTQQFLPKEQQPECSSLENPVWYLPVIKELQFLFHSILTHLVCRASVESAIKSIQIS